MIIRSVSHRFDFSCSVAYVSTFSRRAITAFVRVRFSSQVYALYLSCHLCCLCLMFRVSYFQPVYPFCSSSSSSFHPPWRKNIRISMGFLNYDIRRRVEMSHQIHTHIKRECSCYFLHVSYLFSPSTHLYLTVVHYIFSTLLSYAYSTVVHLWWCCQFNPYAIYFND